MAIFIIGSKIINALIAEDSLSLILNNEEKRSLIAQALLERVSLERICRIFNISMPWLLQFINEIIEELPENLNSMLTSSEELEVAVIELDEQWSYVGKKVNQQWLWLVFHSKTGQVLAMHVGKRTKQTPECLLEKLPEDLKKSHLLYK